ncbi:hypothetical protein E1A91_D10G250500v1 [Gossypium mustelinum]|uniref:Uncharacterized protein n=1 Tax=Gossypium mustelinum TaxID=34275 RepID=A0A5D2TB04_GOSMU|nr:hypothetical protein E1A91_D10G250500v1 [Gossypium mustelinum]
MVDLLSTLKIFYVRHLNLRPLPEEIPIDSKATIKAKSKKPKRGAHLLQICTNTTNHAEQYTKKPIVMVAKMQIRMEIEAHMATAIKSSKWWLDSRDNSRHVKNLKLFNVFHVIEIRKSLLSAHMLCNNELKIVLEFDKVIVSRNYVFVQKYYSYDGHAKILRNPLQKLKEIISY